MDPPFDGPTPAIGFNSAMDFDFDSSDGVDRVSMTSNRGRTRSATFSDFSAVGQREINRM